jgi:protein CrcB
MTGDPWMWVAVVVGAAVGAPLRYVVEVGMSIGMRHTRWHMFPWGLLAVNVLGSATAGVVLARTTGDLRIFLLTGFCGAFTTFSGFAWQTHGLWALARPMWWWSVFGITTACVVAFWLAWKLSGG